MTVSFLLLFYAKMLKNGLNSGVLSTATIKLRKLEEKKLTRHKLSNKQSFKLSAIIDREITRNPEKIFAKRGCFPYAWQFFFLAIGTKYIIEIHLARPFYICPFYTAFF